MEGGVKLQLPAAQPDHALHANIRRTRVRVNFHLRGDVAAGTQLRANTRLYLPVSVLGELYYGAPTGPFMSAGSCFHPLFRTRRDFLYRAWGVTG